MLLKLYSLLEWIGIASHEFEYVVNDYELSPLYTFLGNASEFYNNNNQNKLTKLLVKTNKIIPKKPNILIIKGSQ